MNCLNTLPSFLPCMDGQSSMQSAYTSYLHHIRSASRLQPTLKNCFKLRKTEGEYLRQPTPHTLSCQYILFCSFSLSETTPSMQTQIHQENDTLLMNFSDFFAGKKSKSQKSQKSWQ